MLIAWIWPATRGWHLLVIGLTWIGWLGLGLFLWHRYCPSTDWHWRVKTARGGVGFPNSYVKYYVDRITGLSWDPRLVNRAVLIIGLKALGLSSYGSVAPFVKN